MILAAAKRYLSVLIISPDHVFFAAADSNIPGNSVVTIVMINEALSAHSHT